MVTNEHLGEVVEQL